MRRRLIVANWKMNKTASEAIVYVHQLIGLIQPHAIDLVLAPPFTALHAAKTALDGHVSFDLAGQNLFWEEKGAYTGEISAPMLRDVGCRYVIIGHSERRQWFGERDEGINKKMRAALRHGLRPILCVGESLADREQGRMKTIVTGQLEQDLAGLSADEMTTVAIAYEPVWAIGTARAATPAQATEVHALLRRTVAFRWGADISERIRILYGGSVTPENAKDFLSAADVDGVLVGGSCLDPAGFATIARFAEDQSARER